MVDEAPRSEVTVRAVAFVAARRERAEALYEAGRPSRTPWTGDDPVHHPQPSS